MPVLKQSCKKCSEFLQSSHNQSILCGYCLYNPPSFNRVYALFPYEFPIMQLISRLKFHHKLIYAKAIATLFIQKILGEWYKNKPLPNLIIPIPLHEQRLKQRGFNQAYEMAKPIAKELGVAIDVTGVKRIKHTAAQNQLPSKARKINIADAFAAKRSYTGMTIAVIDDVVTTCSTVTEFSTVLRKNGAHSIDIWCCARNQKL